jgi:hypothetical protein
MGPVAAKTVVERTVESSRESSFFIERETMRN